MERRGVCLLQQHPASPRRHLEAGGLVQSARRVAVAKKGDVKGVASCVLLAGARVDAKRLVPTHSCRCEETLFTPPRGNGSYLFTRATEALFTRRGGVECVRTPQTARTDPIARLGSPPRVHQGSGWRRTPPPPPSPPGSGGTTRRRGRRCSGAARRAGGSPRWGPARTVRDVSSAGLDLAGRERRRTCPTISVPLSRRPRLPTATWTEPCGAASSARAARRGSLISR